MANGLISCSKEANTRSIEGYQEVCESTGGLFVEFSKVDIDDIIGILSSSIESSRVTVVSVTLCVQSNLQVLVRLGRFALFHQ